MYKNGKYWYTSLMVNGKRHTASLRTKDKKIALTRVKQVQNDLYNQIVHGKKDTRKSALSTIKLLKKYLYCIIKQMYPMHQHHINFLTNDDAPKNQFHHLHHLHYII